MNIDQIDYIYDVTPNCETKTNQTTRASGTIASQVDAYNGNYFNDNISIEFKRPFIPSDWLLLTSEDGEGLYGELYSGESNQINIEISTTDLVEGDYNASIIISSNGSSDVEIPLVLSVVPDGGILGDLNGDSTTNVQDIIILITLILDSSNYIENADINMDGVIDVIDVVQLISMILES